MSFRSPALIAGLLSLVVAGGPISAQEAVPAASAPQTAAPTTGTPAADATAPSTAPATSEAAPATAESAPSTAAEPARVQVHKPAAPMGESTSPDVPGASRTTTVVIGLIVLLLLVVLVILGTKKQE